MTSSSHIQPVTCLAVDANSNYLLTGSGDSTIHVWSLLGLLSFASTSETKSPVHSLTTHRAAITALVVGHGASSANIAVSSSADKTAIIWDYQTGALLRTIILPEVALSLTLDPADRALYTSYSDGSVQMIDFFSPDRSEPTTFKNSRAHLNPIYDETNASNPLQPHPSTISSAPSQTLGPALSLALSWDATTLLSGHESGKIATWDIARGAYASTLATLPGPVTNLQFLPPSGFPSGSRRTFKINNVVKPKLGFGSSDSGSVPGNYGFLAQLVSTPPIATTAAAAATFSPLSPSGTTATTSFEMALTHPSFPTALLDEGITELASWNRVSSDAVTGAVGGDASNGLDEDFVPLDDRKEGEVTLEERNRELRDQVLALQRVQKVTFDQLAELRREKGRWLGRVNGGRAGGGEGARQDEGRIEGDVESEEESSVDL